MILNTLTIREIMQEKNIDNTNNNMQFRRSLTEDHRRMELQRITEDNQVVDDIVGDFSFLAFVTKDSTSGTMLQSCQMGRRRN